MATKNLYGYKKAVSLSHGGGSALNRGVAQGKLILVKIGSKTW